MVTCWYRHFFDWVYIVKSHRSDLRITAALSNVSQFSRCYDTLFIFPDINECFPISPCLNNGTCINLEGSYRCNCPPGFTGINCESDVDECLSAPCKFGGTCVNTVGSYFCQCPPGRSGKNCDGDYDECVNNPCINGGTCYNNEGSYSCFCPPGWTGPNCEIGELQFIKIFLLKRILINNGWKKFYMPKIYLCMTLIL